MKGFPGNSLRLAIALASGIAAGYAVRTYSVHPETNVSEPVRGVAAGTSASRTGSIPPAAGSGAWVRNLNELDPLLAPRYSNEFLAAFYDAAEAAIGMDPRAALEAFLAEPGLQRTSTVEVFTELLCAADPLVALELGSKVPAVFASTVQWMVLNSLAHAAPERALAEIRAHTFPMIPKEWLYHHFGHGIARRRDAAGLALIRAALKGPDLETALWGFVDKFAQVEPREALRLAGENPDISGRLRSQASFTLWRDGNVDAAWACLGSAGPKDAADMVTSFVRALYQIPPDALLPAFKKLMQLAAENSTLFPENYRHMACGTVGERVREMSPERLPEFTREAPDGALRESLLR